MSRLDAVAEALGVSSDEARQFTRAVRAHFEAAPSYAQILRAIKEAGVGRPTPQQVAARIRQELTTGERRTRGSGGGRGNPPGPGGRRSPRRRRSG